MATTYGKNLKITIYGGSHDAEIGVIAEGLPKGLGIDIAELERFMQRRAPGRDAFSTARREPDTPVFQSGIEDGMLNGDTLKAVIYNKNQHSSDYNSLKFIYFSLNRNNSSVCTIFNTYITIILISNISR